VVTWRLVPDGDGTLLLTETGPGADPDGSGWADGVDWLVRLLS
jgi:hypothetical protein